MVGGFDWNRVVFIIALVGQTIPLRETPHAPVCYLPSEQTNTASVYPCARFTRWCALRSCISDALLRLNLTMPTFSLFPIHPSTAMTKVHLGDSVTTVDAKVGTSHVAGRVTEQESDSAHQVLRAAHFTLRNQRSPLLGELWVVIENLFGAEVIEVSIAVWICR